MMYPFWCCVIPKKRPRAMFCDLWRMFNVFLSTCAVALHEKHVQNITCRFDTEGFVPVASFYGVVDSPSWFIKWLFGRIGSIWWVMYINGKCTYQYKTRVCTIIECAIVPNVCHVTSTWPFVSWWSVAANVSHNTRIERPSWNSFEVNCVPASVYICSKYHQPNSYTFPNLAWNISSLSMTSSVGMFSIP